MTTSLQPVCPSEEGISRTFRRGTTPVFQKRDHACFSEEGTSLSFRRRNKQPEVERREFWTVGQVGQYLACCS